MRFRRKPHWKQLHDDACYAVTTALAKPYAFEYQGLETHIDRFSCENYEFLLPYGNIQLYQWGLAFGNCVGSYAEGVRTGRYLITGICKNGNLSMIAQWNKRLTRIIHIESPKAGHVPNETISILETIVKNDFRNALKTQGIKFFDDLSR